MQKEKHARDHGECLASSLAEENQLPPPALAQRGSCWVLYMVQIVSNASLLRCNPMRDAALLERF
eukprot:1547921-Prymnesium_polylepis.1